MTSRQTPWPRAWLMTDERVGDRLWNAIDRLPDGQSGVVLRHYSLSLADRTRMGLRIVEICRLKRIVLAVAGDEGLALSLHADLLHNPRRAAVAIPFSRSVHSLEEAIDARADGAALVFISPVYPTLSHPDRPALGEDVAIHFARVAAVPAIALGGMTKAKFPPLERGGFHGWAGIDAWDQASV